MQWAWHESAQPISRVCGGMKELLSHDLDPPLKTLACNSWTLIYFNEKDMFRILSLDPSVLDKS